MFNRYLGKIRAVIKQEGLLGGLKRIFTAIFLIMRPVGSGDILFISSGVVGNSSRFRVVNVAEELKMHGFKCSFAIQERFFLKSYADKFSIFIFHKVNYTPQVAKLIGEIKKQNKEIIFETDDLLFDPKYIKEQDFFKNANSLEKEFYEKGVGTELVNDPYIKTCTTTTSFLAEKLREHNKQVFIVLNKLSRNDLRIAEKINSKIKNNSEIIRIGYFSGALAHNKDFATVTKVLMRIMEKYKNTELFLAGPLNIESELNKFSKRIKQMPYVSREKHFANIASVDINITPLEMNSPFCEAKSELKFFEAGIVKVPTVAAATQTFKEAIEDSVDGFVANGEEEWFEKLEKLIVDENLRKDIGEKAYQKAIEKYSVEKSNNEEYYAYLRNKLK